MRQVKSIDLRENPSHLPSVMNAITNWANSYKTLVVHLLDKANALNCSCCNGTGPNHRDSTRRLKEQNSLEEKIDQLVETVGL